VGTALYDDPTLLGRASGSSISNRWRAQLFDNACLEVPLPPALASASQILTLDPNAAQCFDIALEGFGSNVTVEVSVEAPIDNLGMNDLFAVVSRPDSGESQLPPVAEPQRARPPALNRSGICGWWTGFLRCLMKHPPICW